MIAINCLFTSNETVGILLSLKTSIPINNRPLFFMGAINYVGVFI